MQAKMSFVFKGLAILASFLAVPLTIKYLGVECYGVWSTLLSIVSWIVIFDIGIGNGLRNKISEALAYEDEKIARCYISTAYAIIGFISILLMFIFLTAGQYIPWQKVFNVTFVDSKILQSTVNITAFFLFLNFWLSLINQIFNGFQKTSLVVLNQFLSNAFSLLAVSILYFFYDSSLIMIAFFYGISLVLSNVVLSFWFYGKNKSFIPKIKYFGLNYAKSITSLGFKFFIIQIAVIVIFTTDKILITQLFGVEYVASYDVVFKLFSVITIIHGILMAPLWSAYSDAYHRGDMEWIRKSIKNQLKIYLLIVLATILLALWAKPIVSIWIGKEIVVDTILIIAMALFILVSTWNNIFAYFVNAINKLDVQIATSALAMIINIPLSVVFVKFFKMDVYGIVLATCLSLSLFALFGFMQTLDILKEKNE
ncbi:oligosaccharide flippase family protein [Campylobacter sp. RM13119]|uniref:oligosaccharide flippase family protein n=1 Tax=Campylobacter californiensis TaxID=1032243 RepID=UPI001474F7C4|nr:oligosaccharide flippase family protein [Campylobacter sp. RM13119]MBE3605367.1 oligosaccharide flippase family protein [Campylobacter sp. RM13119]